MRTRRHDGRDEAILAPDLPIIDSHFHLFDLPNNRYLLDDYLTDAQGGHKIVASVYCETQAFARRNGPAWLRPLGEVEFANGIAAMAASGRYGDCEVAAAIVGHADLTQGARIGDLLDRCMAAAPERYRGARQATLDYPDERPFKFIMTHRPPSGLLDRPEFALGLAELQTRGLTYDAALYDPSLPRLAELADRFPDLTIVLDNIGTAVGVDMDADEKAQMFARWSTHLRRLAERPNVICKVAGLGMPVWGFGFEDREGAVGFEDLAAAWRPYVETAIAAFGPARCMLASNFPPDGRSSGFIPLWNAYKHILRACSPDEKADLFWRTAARVYRIAFAGSAAPPT